MLASTGTTAAPTIELLNSRIDELDSSTFSDKEKTALSNLYRKALSSLEIAGNHRQKADAYATVIQNGPDEIARLKTELDKANKLIAAKQLDTNNLALPEIEQQLQKHKADLAVAEAKFSELNNQLNIEKDQPTTIRQRLTLVNSQLTDLSAQSVQPSTEGDAAELAEAQDWAISSLREQLRAEALMLEQELSSQPIRLDLLTARRDLAEINQLNLKRRVDGLEESANNIRLQAAETAKAQAIAAEREAASKHQLVAQLASLNTQLSEEIDRLANELNDINQDEVAATQSAKRVEEAFNTTRQKLEITGLSQVLGQVLQQEMRALPDTGHFRKLASIREEKFANTSLSQIQLEQERRKLRDIESYITSLTDSLAADERIEVIAELQVLANSRKALIDNALSVQRAYLQALGELDVSQRRQQDAVERYGGFLAKRLLWIRSTEQVGLDTMYRIPGQLSQLFAVDRWQEVLQTLLNDALLAPLPAMALLIAIAVLLMRHKLHDQLRGTGKHIGNLRLDRLSETLRAIGLVILLSLPGPVMMLIIGWELNRSFEASNFSKLVGNTLLLLAPMLFHLSAFRLFLAPNSIARVHFKWPVPGVERLYNDLGWFTPVAVGLAFVTALAAQDQALGSGSGLGRALFITLMATFALFFYRLTKLRGGTFSVLASATPDSILARYRYLWFALFVGPPIASIIVSLAGYMYTAGTLIERILQSAWFALLIIVIHQFILRWLTLNQRRLRLEAALAKRRAEQEARANRSTVEETEGFQLSEIEEPEVDLGSLSSTSRKLLNNTLVLAGLVGLWAIWRDVLPALQIFNDITLWSYIRSGSSETIPITLSSLILALLVVVITIIATRQLPAFLEMILLQRLNMSQGSRYTVTTLTRYTVIAVGVAWIFGFLGGSWSEIQWIFAALGVGIGFGLQEIVANFISGLIILFERPIRVGDVVTVGNTDGVVTRIQIRATTIRNFDRKELLVPNKNFITQELLNWSLSDQTTRILIQVGIAYGSDAKHALQIMENVAKEHQRVMEDPAPFTVFESFGDNALLLSLRCYIDDIDHRLRTITDINLAIDERMKEAGIEIAFPQRDIHLDTRQPLDIRLHRNKPESS